MNKGSRNRYAGMLLGLGIGIALAVALDNIAIGIGVGVVFMVLSATGPRKDQDLEE